MADPVPADKIDIFLVATKMSPPVLAQIHKHYSASKEVEISHKSIEELKVEMDANKKCIVIFTIVDGGSVNEFIGFSQQVRNKIRVKKVIPVALLKSSNPKIEDILVKSGCSEVLTFNTTFKSLTHKLNRHLKLLELNKADENDQFEAVERKPNEAAPKAAGPQVLQTSPIEAKQDFWLLMKKNHAKKYVTNWLVELIGPSPAAGAWKKTSKYKTQFPNSEEQWEWIANDAKSYFHTEGGSWVFIGNQPEYNWSMNRWGFVGEAAELSYVQDAKILYSRFKGLTPLKLEITNNSAYATSAMETIKNTYDKTHSFSQEKSKIPWGELDSDDDDGIQWNQGDLSVEEDLGYLRNLLTSPGYKIRGTLNQFDIQLLGFGDEPNCIFIGFAEPVTTRESEVVILKLIVDGGVKPVVHEMRGSISKIHEIEPMKFIAKVNILQDWTDKLDKVKRTFHERGKIASTFIQKAKGIESNVDTVAGADSNSVVQNFLQNNHIIIMDSVSSARISLASSLVKIGAIRKKMSLVSSIEMAKEETLKHDAKIIFSDYMIGNRSGLGFIQDFKRDLDGKGIRESLAILVTSNASQSAVARAAEGDIDNFIVKPYPYENLRKVVVQTIQDKFNPNPYLKLVDQGKDFILIKEIPKAIEVFKKAMAEDPHPALALSYLGQLSLLEKNYSQAERYFTEALSHNQIHFSSLMGLHDLLFEQRRFDEAYKVARDLVKYFPAHPVRLSNVLRASIVTDNFKDIQEYYKVYLEMDERTDDLVKYICSAMVVGGKHFLKKGDTKTAMELLERGAVSAGGRIQYLYYIIETLVNQKLLKESQAFLKRLYTMSPASEDYQAAKYLVSTLTMPGIDIVYQGRELLKKGVETPAVYEKLILHSKIEGYEEEAVDLVKIASAKWPDKKDLFKI